MVEILTKILSTYSLAIFYHLKSYIIASATAISRPSETLFVKIDEPTLLLNRGVRGISIRRMTSYVSFQHLSTRSSRDFIMLSPDPSLAVCIHNLDQSHGYNWGVTCKQTREQRTFPPVTLPLPSPQWLYNTHITTNVALTFPSVL